MSYRRSRTFISIGIVVGAFIFLHWVGLLSPMEKGARFVIYAGSHALYQWTIGISQAMRFSESKKKLIQEVDSLKAKQNDTTVDQTRLKIVEDENTELREQLHFFATHNVVHVGAEVIGRSINPLGTEVIINKGVRDGIGLNNPVIVGDGILIGKISSVDTENATIRLINDNNSKIAASIINNAKSIGLVEGGYGIGVHMNFIPQNEAVNPNDVVVTSGLTEGIPRGLLIGTVQLVEKQPHEPFQQAVLQPIADLSHIYLVSVIIHTADTPLFPPT